MSYLQALLVAEAHARGRAQRSAVYCHRHLARRPMGILCWQLGAEPFTAAAFAWGFGPGERHVVVPGEPRDRELTFRALGEAARAFNRWFEGGHGGEPQVVLPNRGNLKLLGRLGRRLAYLSNRDGRAPDPELVRFGRHLGFLAEHARYPGQQLVVVLTDLLAEHWVTGLSDLEGQNLAALDAAIDPPRGQSGEEAAARAESLEIGPMPGMSDDSAVEKLMQAFDEARGRSGGRLVTDARVVGRLLGPIQDHYERLVDRGWPLLWRCLQRERTYPAARSVTRRWEHDLERLGRHLEWVVGKGGAYRTRQTHVQAAQRLADWERAAALLEAEEIVDDPLRAIPCLLRHEGFQGRVVKVNLENREAAGRRPLVDVETDDPCLMPGGKEVYWTATPAAAAWTVESISPSRRGGSTIRLKRTSRTDPGAEPQVGAMVTFTVYTTRPNGYRAPVPGTVPWTHERATPQESPSIEDGDGRPWE